LLDGIRKFEWDWDNDGTPDKTDEPGDGKEDNDYSPGEHTLRVKVYDNDENCCCSSGPNCQDGEAEETYDIVALDVGKIEVEYSPNLWDDVTDESIVVLAGTKYTFKATPDPDSKSWPTDQPKWEWDDTNGDPEGEGDTYEMTFDTAGEYILKAQFLGCSRQVTINVIAPQIDEVKYVDASGAEWNDIYDGDDMWLRTRTGRPGKNDPGSFVKNKHTAVSIKFWHEDDLTYATSGEVKGIVDFYSFAYTGGGYSADIDFGTSWPCGVSGILSTTKVRDYVCLDENVDIGWEYKIPSPAGTNDWVGAGSSEDLKYYIVWDEPATGSPDTQLGYDPTTGDMLEAESFQFAHYTKGRIKQAIGWGEEVGGMDPEPLLNKMCTSVERTDIFTAVDYEVAKCWAIDDTTTGDCGNLACNLAYGARCLGVPAFLAFANLKDAIHMQKHDVEIGSQGSGEFEAAHSGFGKCTTHGQFVWKWGIAGTTKNAWQGCVWIDPESPLRDTRVWSPNGDHQKKYWELGNAKSDDSNNAPGNPPRYGCLFDYEWLDDNDVNHDNCNLNTSGWRIIGSYSWKYFETNGN
jgi:hypothetical protein